MSKINLSKNFPLLACNDFENLRANLKLSDIEHYTAFDFKQKITQRLNTLTFNEIIGLDLFPHKDLITGCNHFIDNVIMQYGLKNIQIFEHDYSYYKRIRPNITYTTLETLDPNKPLLMAAPFPGHLGLHRQFKQIIKRCEEIGTKVYLDGAWFPPSFGILLDLTSPCIESIAFSCSKAYDLGDNRIGIRYSKHKKTTDSITQLNDRNMISRLSYQIACKFLDNFAYDHIVSLYKEDYDKVVKDLKLRPSNMVHAVFSIDWKNLYGIKDVLPKK